MRAISIATLLLVAASVAAQPVPGYQASVTVSGATRLDWSCVLGPSRTIPLPGYESTKQTYELYVAPKGKKKFPPSPMVLFVSAGSEPSGWKAFAKLCQARGFVFAGPRGAGNEVPGARRVRIVLDVLDDVRRKHPIDPDRTYVAGFSGGGRIACGIAFGLPELVGGAMSLGAAGDLREESWLRHRVIDRLSVAYLAGATDFNRGEVERFRGPMLNDVGVRVKWWIQPGLGHALPGEKYLGEALTWLDEAAKERSGLANQQATTRIAWNAAPTREERARELLAEGKALAGKRSSQYRGLMQIKGVMQRYPDLPAAREAEAFLTDVEKKGDNAWEADDVAEQRRFLIARARALDAYATGPLPAEYARQKPEMLKAAMQLYQLIIKDRPDSAAAAEAKKRLAVLEKALGKE